MAGRVTVTASGGDPHALILSASSAFSAPLRLNGDEFAAEAERVAEKSPTAIVHAVEEIPTPRGVIMKTTWGMGMHITMITLNTGTARARV